MENITRIAPPYYQIMMLSRRTKKVIMMLFDVLALIVALWSGYALRLAEWWPTDYLSAGSLLFALVPFVGVLVFNHFGLYRAVVHFMGAHAIFSVIKGVIALSGCLWLGAIIAVPAELFPKSVPVNFALAALVYVGGGRLLVRNYYHWAIRHYIEKEPVLIYGAGGAGVQLATALMSGAEYLPIGFLDDDKSLERSTVIGLPVYNPSELHELIREHRVAQVLLALPSLSLSQRRAILESLTDYAVHIKTIPSMAEIVSGESVASLREIDLEDLLGRDTVPPDPELISRSLTNKTVLITGAGGSIGSEICRQVLRNRPSSIILYEMSEYALYAIEKELRYLASSLPKPPLIFPVLGSILDEERVRRVFEKFPVDTIYHAAAYKHVPMVEHNIFEGIRNNALGTKVMAEAALRARVRRFVLISTDKAVRPTNVMGATKRLAELILQDLSLRSQDTVFSMVRFGNVLGSSGSVVPLFREQIKAGGPVTVTHPEITRFFMTIPEAATLVIQAGSMAHGGDVFVLDMGEPVRITDLARRMIHLMGSEIKSTECPRGISIEYSGLRPGEKLYEELLIGEDVVGTEHPKIMRAQEEQLNTETLHQILSQLDRKMLIWDNEGARALLEAAVSGFKPNTPIVDWLSEANKSLESKSIGGIH